MNVSKINSVPAFKGIIKAYATNNKHLQPVQMENISTDVFTRINKLKDGTELLADDNFGLFISNKDASFQDIMAAMTYAKVSNASIDLCTIKDCTIKNMQSIAMHKKL